MRKLQGKRGRNKARIAGHCDSDEDIAGAREPGERACAGS